MKNQYSREAYAEVHKLYDIVESLDGCRRAIFRRIVDKYSLNAAEADKLKIEIFGKFDDLYSMEEKLQEVYRGMGEFATTFFNGNVGFEEPNSQAYQQAFDRFMITDYSSLEKKVGVFLSELDSKSEEAVCDLEIAFQEIFDLSIIDTYSHPSAKAFADDVVEDARLLKLIIESKARAISGALLSKNAKKENAETEK